MMGIEVITHNMEIDGNLKTTLIHVVKIVP